MPSGGRKRQPKRAEPQPERAKSGPSPEGNASIPSRSFYTGRPVVCRPQPMASFPQLVAKLGLFAMLLMIALRLRLQSITSFGKVRRL